jgi:NADPH:quinone reductase
MTKAIRISETGGPEVLKWEDVELADPSEGEVRLKHTAIGLNFIDCYQRSGLYPIELPLTLGTEAAGVVEAVGPGVTNLKIGQRVAYAGGQIGSYCEARNIDANVPVIIPDGIEDQTAAAMMLKGMTVHMLMFKCYQVKAGDTILVHAAAGGVGSIMCQWANALGATVIGTVGSEEKAEKAKANGCHHPINYSTEDFAARVMEITDGKGVPVVYESIGLNTYEKSMDSLSNFGTLVNFGNASGPIPAIEPLELMRRGSLALSRPTLFNYTADPEMRQQAAKDLFDVVASGKVKIEIGQTFPLADTAKAHIALESRQTMGSTILIP